MHDEHQEDLPDTAELGRTIDLRTRPEANVDRHHFLRVVQGDGVQRAVELTEEPLVLGRDPARPFHLAQEEISRSHCEVRLASGRVFVRDLASTNGTYVDGRRVEGHVQLRKGSHLQLGRFVLRHEMLTPEEVARETVLARELDEARRYVRDLIPAPVLDGPVRAEWCFVPSSVLGGDGLGYHFLGDGRFAFYVVDVCGHGVGSAVHSASVLNAVRGESIPDTDFGDPAAVLAGLNRVFDMDEHGGMYLTAWYGVVDAAKDELVFASAGHPPAVLVREGEACRVTVANPPVGTLPDRAFVKERTTFGQGDRLYVFSDGAYEVADEGLDHLEARIVAGSVDRSVGEARRLYNSVLDAADGSLLEDDFTLLLVSRA